MSLHRIIILLITIAVANLISSSAKAAPDFDFCTQFADGMAYIRIDHKWGFIDWIDRNSSAIQLRSVSL